MGLPADNINPIDAILSRLSKAPSIDELPMKLRCPSQHTAQKVVATLTGESGEEVDQIPFWVCPMCRVGYRYNECALIPGDEGAGAA